MVLPRRERCHRYDYCRRCLSKRAGRDFPILQPAVSLLRSGCVLRGRVARANPSSFHLGGAPWSRAVQSGSPDTMTQAASTWAQRGTVCGTAHPAGYRGGTYPHPMTNSLLFSAQVPEGGRGKVPQPPTSTGLGSELVEGVSRPASSLGVWEPLPCSPSQE